MSVPSAQPLAASTTSVKTGSSVHPPSLPVVSLNRNDSSNWHSLRIGRLIVMSLSLSLAAGMIAVMTVLDRTVHVASWILICLPNRVELEKHGYVQFYRTAYHALVLTAAIPALGLPSLYLYFDLFDEGDATNEGDGSPGETVLLVVQLVNQLSLGGCALSYMTEFVCSLYALIMSNGPMTRFSLSPEEEPTTWKEQILSRIFCNFWGADLLLGFVPGLGAVLPEDDAVGTGEVSGIQPDLRPIGITFGLFLGSRLQRRRERWFVARTAAVWTPDPKLDSEEDGH